VDFGLGVLLLRRIRALVRHLDELVLEGQAVLAFALAGAGLALRLTLPSTQQPRMGRHGSEVWAGSAACAARPVAATIPAMVSSVPSPAASLCLMVYMVRAPQQTRPVGIDHGSRRRRWERSRAPRGSFRPAPGTRD
jgi:hypothetical protein